MWTALVMTAALSYAPQQAEDLTLTNVRPTTGIFSPARKDADNPKVIPGDVLFYCFDIENLKVAEDGKVKYSVGMEWKNKQGKTLFKAEPQPLDAINSLGGTRAPGFIAAPTTPDTPVGEYTVTATVKDRTSNKEATFTKKFEVVPTAFALVRLVLSIDEAGNLPTPPLAVPGQRLVVNFHVTGFEREKTSKSPNITFKLRVLENGIKPVLGKDAGGSIKDVPENYKMVQANFQLQLNRAGKFTAELEATDEVSKKKSSQTIDILVQELK
jgi:hypothetical protein